MRACLILVISLPAVAFLLPGSRAGEGGKDFESKLEAVVKALKDPDRNTRRQAAELLVELGPAAKRVLLPLIEALGDKDRVVRATVARALAGIGPDAVVAVPSLKEALKDKDCKARLSSGIA